MTPFTSTPGQTSSWPANEPPHFMREVLQIKRQKKNVDCPTCCHHHIGYGISSGGNKNRKRSRNGVKRSLPSSTQPIDLNSSGRRDRPIERYLSFCGARRTKQLNKSETRDSTSEKFSITSVAACSRFSRTSPRLETHQTKSPFRFVPGASVCLYVCVANCKTPQVQ